MMLPLTLEKTSSLVLICDLGIHTFFGLGDTGVWTDPLFLGHTEEDEFYYM
jgi:hypothetical protein